MHRTLTLTLCFLVLAGCKRAAPPAEPLASHAIPDHMFGDKGGKEGRENKGGPIPVAPEKEVTTPKGWWSGSAWEEYPRPSEQEVQNQLSRMRSGLPAVPADRIVVTTHLRFADDGTRVLECFVRVRPSGDNLRAAPDILIWYEREVKQDAEGRFTFREGRLAMDLGLSSVSDVRLPGDVRPRRVQDVDATKTPLYDAQRKRFKAPQLVCQLVNGQVKGRLYEAGDDPARGSEKSYPCLALPRRPAEGTDFLSYERAIFARLKDAIELGR